MTQTDFDPTVHGFMFPNRFPGGAVVAELARQHRLAELIGVQLPGAVRHLARLVENEDFWGTFGLCGGMSWGAIDRHRRGVPVPGARTSPASGEDLFSELVGLQADSMRGRRLMERCLGLQVVPDRTPWWWFWSQGVLDRTIDGQLPLLRDSLDRGAPTALTLIRASGTQSPARHHQVVAIGYEATGTDRTAIQLYDPNHPLTTVTLRLTTRPKQPEIEADGSTGRGLRGFVVWTPVANMT